MKTYSSKHINDQNGAVLIVSLLMLLVTTMLGITAMSTAVMEEKMAGNNYQKQLAFQGAESGLRFAETWLSTQITDVPSFGALFATSTTNNELYSKRKPDSAKAVDPVPSTFNKFDLTSWTAGNSIQIAQALVPGQPNPRYIIEYMGKDGIDAPVNEDEQDARKHMFRITSIGTGTDQVTTQVAQSTFRMPLF